MFDFSFTSIPRRAKEIFMKLPESTLAELIDNKIYILPMPDLNYHDLRNDIIQSMLPLIKQNKLGDFLCMPIDVFLDENIVLQPDLLFISKQNREIIKDDRIKGAPDLIIEITTPGYKKHDTITKKKLYEKFGVKEYFVVDPETKETITWYLVAKKYIKQPIVKAKLKSKLLKKTFSF